MVAVQFVLSGRRQCDIAFFTPRLSSFYIFATIFLCVFADTTTVQVLQFHDVIQLFAVDTVRIVDVTVRVGASNYFTTQFDYFFDCILSYVTRTGNKTNFTFQVSTFGFQHFHQEVDVTVTGSFRTNQ